MLLGLNMVYCNILLIKETRNLCTIILPWVKYQYKRLPMGVSNSLVFQEKTNDLFQGFHFLRIYIDKLLILTRIDFNDH